MSADRHFETGDPKNHLNEEQILFPPLERKFDEGGLE